VTPAEVLEDLDSHEDIARLTGRLLRKAEAYGRLPTPVEDILAAADLEEEPDTFLSQTSIAKMPEHMRSVLRRVSSKVHAALDRKTRTVHINPATDLVGQKAFKRLHETSHDLFPWQHIELGQIGFADDEMTLSQRTTIRFEREANQGAAELLFQRELRDRVRHRHRARRALWRLAPRDVPPLHRVAPTGARGRSPRSSTMWTRTARLSTP
jgi:DNA polymerase III psi subunit